MSEPPTDYVFAFTDGTLYVIADVVNLQPEGPTISITTESGSEPILIVSTAVKFIATSDAYDTKVTQL